jgi:D-sedoheptulose 7-phosphate isomerase
LVTTEIEGGIATCSAQFSKSTGLTRSGTSIWRLPKGCRSSHLASLKPSRSLVLRSLRAANFSSRNGGSAADAQHIAAELTGRFQRERKPLPALALHGNASALTAIGNDYGFEFVFARELSAHARRGDVLLAISTSGNSPNILRAIEAARRINVSVIGLTGRTGGKMKDLCDLCLCVASASTPRIQEMHITIAHTICELLEERLAQA